MLLYYFMHNIYAVQHTNRLEITREKKTSIKITIRETTSTEVVTFTNCKKEKKKNTLYPKNTKQRRSIMHLHKLPFGKKNENSGTFLKERDGGQIEGNSFLFI